MTKQWADHPFKLISTPTKEQTQGLAKETVQVATYMSLAHNLIVRSLNSVYLQAPNVSKPEDIADFITFSQIATEAIHHHHSVEERFFFPRIAEYTGKPDIMEGNLAQHQAFEKGVDEFLKYLQQVTVETYDGKEIVRMLDSFGPVLETHLAEEIQTLLGLDQYGGENLMKTWKFLDKKVLDELEDIHRVLPFALGANDRTFENGANSDWPHVPFFLPLLSKYYYSRKHKGCWKFSPCDMDGRPKTLTFAPDL